MSTPTIEAMAERLERLERDGLAWRREARRWRRAAALAVIGTAILAAAGARRPEAKAVEAERFVLRDRAGKMRAEMLVKDGDAGQIFFDERGKPRLQLGVGPGGSAGIVLLNKDGGPGLVLNRDEDGRVELSGYGKSGDKPRLALSVEPDGLPTLSLIDKDGEERIGLNIDPENKASLTLWGRDKEIVFRAPRP